MNKYDVYNASHKRHNQLIRLILVCFALNMTLACAQKIKANAMPAQDSTPACITKRIEEIRKQPVWSPAAEIHEYTYNNQTVYLISADCCDQFTTLTNKNCDTLCAPAGGFTGRGDGKCPDFNEKAKHIRLVWKDERGN